jgi:hypothetical protein
MKKLTLCESTLPVVLVALAAACQPKAEPPAATPEGGDACSEASLLIEDAEDGDGQIITKAGRGGYVYTYKDEVGSTVEPSGNFSPESGGAEGSSYALRMHGKLASSGDLYVGMGFGFNDPESAYNAAAYKGIAFYAKHGPDSAPFVRVKVPDINTHPKGKVCKECYNDFGFDVPLSPEWKRFIVPFSALTQEQGWGDPQPQEVDPAQLFGIQWQVSQADSPFDIWLDDVAFVCDIPGQ